jgi:DNA repair exonuclease SbcCD ATPase subunit
MPDSTPIFPRLARTPVPAGAGGDDPLGPPQTPAQLRSKFDRLQGQRLALQKEHRRRSETLTQLAAYLDVAPQVEQALEKLSEDLFGKLAQILEEHLTLALREVLQQPIALKVQRDFKRGAATMRFHIDRDGQEEDIMRGQGGSVANVLSVGLRLFALAQLDKKVHRRFLVLDEHDCWLAPDLVPRLVKIVHQAARAMGFQVILISHHATSCFEPYADRILRLSPGSEGVTVEDVTPRSRHVDHV